MLKQGLSIHCHHDTLLEYCYDYDERVEAIKRDKPEHEQEIRLRLFKMLPRKAIAELPKKLMKAYAEWGKAYAEWEKAYAEWDNSAQKIWHDKWCGCKNWKNGIIDFTEQNHSGD